MTAELRTLVFTNVDAVPKTQTVRCDTASVPLIMAWYGSYFVGDRYTVAVDGKNITLDQGGEPKDAIE